MEEGSAQTVVVPLLKGNLNFIWNHGWFYGTDYDTDAECAFVIKNSKDEVLYTSGILVMEMKSPLIATTALAVCAIRTGAAVLLDHGEKPASGLLT